MQGRGWGAGVEQKSRRWRRRDTRSIQIVRAQSGGGNRGSSARRGGLPVLRVARIY